MNKRERRSQIELMIEILKLCSDNHMNKTKIINLTNLNSKIGNEYILFLIEKEYLSLNGSTYQTSENGKKFLDKINEIQEDIVNRKSKVNT
jgi:predicted transcriptional regulator